MFKKIKRKKSKILGEDQFKSALSPLPTIQNLPDLPADEEPTWIFGLNAKGERVKFVSEQADQRIRLTGDVLGEEIEEGEAQKELGEEEGDIPTTLATPIDSHGDRLINVGEPITGTDAANKSYVDANAGGGTVTLEGDVIGSGETGSPITTTLARPLDADSQKITQVAMPTIGTDAANKSYVDEVEKTITLEGDVTGSGETGTPINVTLARPLDADSQKVLQVADPTDLTDGANKKYVDEVEKTITLEGDVTGSGETGTPITASLSKPIKAGNDKIIQVGDPTAPSDAANKAYVDNTEKTITLEGDVTGSGETGTPINVTLTRPLDAGNQKITQVATPTIGTDAANKSYVDANAGGGTVTLEGAVIGTGAVGSPITTSLKDPIDISAIKMPTGSRYFTTDFQNVSSGPGRFERIYSLSTDVQMGYSQSVANRLSDTGRERRWNNSYDFREAYGRQLLNYNNGEGLNKNILDLIVDVSTGTALGSIRLNGSVFVESGQSLSIFTPPTSSNHATNKAYVDGVSLSLEEKITKLENRIMELEKSQNQ